MNIVINAVLAFEKPRGVGRYLNELLPALAEIDKSNQYFIYYGKWMKAYDFLNVQQENFTFIELNISNNQIFRNLYLAYILPLKCKKYRPDIYFLPDTQATFVKPCKIISTIHDIMEFDFPRKYSKMQGRLRRMVVRRQCKISDQIMTVSKFSKAEIIRYLKVQEDKVSVVPNSVAIPKIGTKVCDPEKYFLFVSETEWAKNAIVLLKAFNLLDEKVKKAYKINIVGKKGNQYDEMISYIDNNGLHNKVEFYGYVSDDELKELYSKAYAFVFPSFFEGFGLPILEAMAQGVPVICSDRASMPEVGGEAVLTFDPHDPVALANVLNILINDALLRKTMIQKGLARVKDFSVSNQAEMILNKFKSLYDETKNKDNSKS